MKQYLKVWGVTVLCSFLFIMLPWGMAGLGITSEIDVLEWQGILSALFGLLISVIYVVRKVKIWKVRMVIILLNPTIYYVIVLMYIGLTFTYGPWTALTE